MWVALIGCVAGSGAVDSGQLDQDSADTADTQDTHDTQDTDDTPSISGTVQDASGQGVTARIDLLTDQVHMTLATDASGAVEGTLPDWEGPWLIQVHPEPESGLMPLTFPVEPGDSLVFDVTLPARPAGVAVPESPTRVDLGPVSWTTSASDLELPFGTQDQGLAAAWLDLAPQPIALPTGDLVGLLAFAPSGVVSSPAAELTLDVGQDGGTYRVYAVTWDAWGWQELGQHTATAQGLVVPGVGELSLIAVMQ